MIKFILVITLVTPTLILGNNILKDPFNGAEIFVSVAVLYITLAVFAVILIPFKRTECQTRKSFTNNNNYSSVVGLVKLTHLFAGILFFLIFFSCNTGYAQTAYCEGSAVSLEPQGVKAGHTFKRWEYSPDNTIYTTIAEANQQTYTFTAQYTPNNSGYYRAVYGTNGAVEFWYTYLIVVNQAPSPPTVNSSGSLCGSGTISLTASNSSGSYRWYDAASGGNLISSSPTYTTSVLSTSRTYYASAINTTTGCESPRTPVTATVNQIPTAPSTTGATRNDPGTLDLTASGAPENGSYRWYATNTGGTAISGVTGATYTTPTLSETTDYYVSTVSPGGCESPRTTVTATITSQAPLPIQLASFTGITAAGRVQLQWITASEIDNDRFEVERSTRAGDFRMIGTVRGSGNSSQVIRYDFTDAHPGAGTVYYRLRQVDFSGEHSYSKVVSVSLGELPERGKAEAYPTPFQRELNALVTLPAAGEVTLEVVDVRGRVVHTARRGMQAGVNEVSLALNQLGSGLYFLKVTGSQVNTTLKVLKAQ